MLPITYPALLRSQCYINGEWVDADSGAVLAVTNPATGALLTTVPQCSSAQTRAAIDGATLAQRAWRQRTAAQRASVLHTWHGLLLQHQEDLAHIMTAEQGKPLAEARGEIAYAAAFIQWFAEEGKRTYGDVIPSPFPNSRVIVVKEPVGVCAAITPWNFPAAMITRKVAPADQLNIGTIGIKGMGWSNTRSALKIPGVNLVAVCDIDQGVIADRMKDLEEMKPGASASPSVFLKMKRTPRLPFS